MIGKTIGNYRIVEKLGKGATGTVYKALDETLGREVAIKTLHADVAQSDVMKRFQREVRALANLNHPEIATIHDVQVTSEGVIVVTELVRGESLEALIQRLGPLPPERAALLVSQILGALAAAHTVNVVHRDLKPSSVMITELGTVKLLDFAMAPVEGASQMTAAAFTIGMPAYMAPERILGNDVDARADLYSVGVVLYKLLTGKVPFESADPTAMVQEQLTGLPTPAHIYRADLPQWCEDVLSRAIAKSPADRFQTANDFRAALLESIVPASSEATGVYKSVAVESPAGDDGPTLAMPVPLTAAAETQVAPSGVKHLSPVDPNAATFMTAIPAEALAVPGPEDPTGPVEPPAVGPPMATPAIDPMAATMLTAAPLVDPMAATMLTAMPAGLTDVTMAGSRLADFSSDTTSTMAGRSVDAVGDADGATTFAPAVAGDGPTMRVPAAYGDDSPTMLVPAASAPTVAVPMEALAPTQTAPVPAGTLVMQRKQFAAAGAILGVLVLGVVVLAIVVLRRPAPVATTPAPLPVAVTTPAPAAPAPPPAAETPTLVATATPPPEKPAEVAPPPPPIEITEPAIKASPDVPVSTARGTARGSTVARGATPTAAPAATPPANPNMARITDTTPFTFESRAVVRDGDKWREREADVEIADGNVSVKADGKEIYRLSIGGLTSLTYSNSRQPLWDSPSGPAEAMRVEGGGFLGRGRRNWLGFRAPDALLMVRIEDNAVGRVIANLQERTGLTVARLIEPKE